MQEHYGVGRASLREALRILEIHGLIKVKAGPRGGPVVTRVEPRDFGQMASMYFQMSGATFDELLEAAMLLEPMIVRHLAEHHSDQQLLQLQRVIARAEVGRSGNTTDLDADDSFHRVIARIPGNRVLELLSAAVQEIYWNRFDGKGGRPEVHEEHRVIAEAIVAGDALSAEQLMREHMQHLARWVRETQYEALAETVDWVGAGVRSPATNLSGGAIFRLG
jgi:DNA-binding FadR family transcriptional regulator